MFVETALIAASEITFWEHFPVQIDVRGSLVILCGRLTRGNHIESITARATSSLNPVDATSGELLSHHQADLREHEHEHMQM